MDSLIKQLHFVDTGENQREKENFQGYLFQNIDMSKRNTGISFYRSDFRGAKFHDVKFKNNNFSNADFIDSFITKSSFQDCTFEFTEIYNTYFDKSEILSTNFNAASFVKLFFHECDISKSKFNGNTFKDCKFKDCKLIDNNFEMDSMNDIEFENTIFQDVDISSMTAINLFFNNCTFKNVIIDADYIGSYFFKGQFIEDVKLKYRGQIFDLDISQLDLLNNLFKIFLEKERYYEALNILVQKNFIEKKQSSIFSLLRNIITKLFKENNQLKRAYQVDKIFKMFEYYINTGYIPINDYFKAIGFLEQLDISNLEFFEQIEFDERIYRLKTIIARIDFNVDFLSTIEPSEKVLLEIKIEEVDENEFEICWNDVMLNIANKLSLEGATYQIIDKRKGSLIYDIVIWASAALLFSKILNSFIKTNRDTIHEVMNIAIDYKTNIKVLSKIKKLRDKDGLEEIEKFKTFQIKSNETIKSSTKENTEEIEKLLSLVKSLVIYPNALPKAKD